MRGAQKIKTPLKLSRLIKLAAVLNFDFFSVGSGFLVLEQGRSEAAKGPGCHKTHLLILIAAPWISETSDGLKEGGLTLDRGCCSPLRRIPTCPFLPLYTNA